MAGVCDQFPESSAGCLMGWMFVQGALCGWGWLEGHQLRARLAAGLFNQPRATQQAATEIREKGLLFKLTFKFPTYLPQTVGVLKEALCALHKAKATQHCMGDFSSDGAPPSPEPENTYKDPEQLLLLPAVQFYRRENAFGKNQSNSSCFVIVAGAERNSRRQKKIECLIAEPPDFYYPTKLPCSFGDK